MATPTTQFRTIPLTTAATAIDIESERTASISGQAIVSTGVGNEADFGTVDISGGAADSGVLQLLFNCTVNGGNTEIADVRLWLSSNGFDQAGSVVKVQPISGADTSVPVNTENYVINAVVGTYTWATMAETLPGAANLYTNDGSTGEQTTTDITTVGTSDDSYMWAVYAAIAASETAGTYKGTDAGFELQYSLRYSFS